MIETLWSPVLHPGTIVGRDGAGTLVLLAGAVATVTAGFMATVGRRVMRRRGFVAVLMGCAFLPLLMNLAAYAVAVSHPVGTDGGGILIFASLVLSMCASPVTMATSVLYVVMRSKRLPP